MADWLPELVDDDLATLIEALEAWEEKDLSNQMFVDVLDMIVGPPRDPAERAALSAQRAGQTLDRKRLKAVRKERSIILRAKLLTLRDRRRVERVTS